MFCKCSNVMKVAASCMLVFVLLAVASCRGEGEGQPDAGNPSGQAAEEVSDIPQINMLSGKIAEDSTNAELYFTRGNMYLQFKMPEKAALDFYKAITIDSLRPEYYIVTADLYFNFDQMKTAVNILQKGASVLPDNQRIKTELGKYYFYAKQYDLALEQLEAAEKLKPDDGVVYFWQGMVYRDMGERGQAIAKLEKAIATDSELYDAYIILAQFFADKNDPKAVELYNKALELDPTSPEARYFLGMFWQNRGEDGKAIAQYRQLIENNPQHAYAHYNIGHILFNQKKYAEAKTNFNMAVRVKPDYAEAYYMRGFCDEKTDKPDEAKKDYERALTFDPELELAKEGLKRLGF